MKRKPPADEYFQPVLYSRHHLLIGSYWVAQPHRYDPEQIVGRLWNNQPFSGIICPPENSHYLGGLLTHLSACSIFSHRSAIGWRLILRFFADDHMFRRVSGGTCTPSQYGLVLLPSVGNKGDVILRDNMVGDPSDHTLNDEFDLRIRSFSGWLGIFYDEGTLLPTGRYPTWHETFKGPETLLIIWMDLSHNTVPSLWSAISRRMIFWPS